ncbi:MAG: carboxypeptidase regulatory-like domain-containing protein [Planctomycetota bacterium]
MKRALVVGTAMLVSLASWLLFVDLRSEPVRESMITAIPDSVGEVGIEADIQDSRHVEPTGGNGGTDTLTTSLSAVFRGRVLDLHGSPPRDAVIAIDRDGRRIAASSCQPDGQFEIATEVGGVVAIIATARGGASHPRRVRAVVGMSHDVGALLIEPIEPITGTVVDDLGRPVPAATVLAVASDSDDARRRTAATDPEGSFRLDTRLPVTELKVDARGFVSRIIEVDSLPVRIELERALEHRGRVIDARSGDAVPNAVVHTQRCSSDGSFTIASSRSSGNTVVVRAHGYATRNVELSDPAASFVTIRLDPLESLAGIVLDPDGQPLPDALVRCVATTRLDPPIQVRSDHDGRFRLPVDRASACSIEATKGHLRASLNLPRSFGPDRDIVIRTERLVFATIVGRLPSIADPASAVVALTRDEAPARFTRLDRHGQFRFEDVEPGRVALAAYSENSNAERSVRSHPRVADAREGIILDLHGGDHREVLLEPVADRSGRVRGSARDRGAAAGHLAAILTPLSDRLDGSHRRRVNVSARGDYEFTHVVEGRYRVALVNRVPIELTDYSTPLEELELCSATIDVSAAGDHIIDLDADTDLLVFTHTRVVRSLRLVHRESRESRLDLRRARTGFLVPRETLMLRVMTADGAEVTQPISPLGDREIDLRGVIR